MSSLFSFIPSQNQVQVSATAASGNVQLPAVTSMGNGTSLLIVNTSATLFVGVNWGTSNAVTASLANNQPGIILPPLGMKIITPPFNTAWVAAIGSGAGPTIVAFIMGDGT